MSKPLQSSWKLTDTSLSREEFIKAFQDFEYFMGHCQQIVNKQRQLVPMALNPYQREIFRILLPMIDPKTRENKAKSILFIKGRRVGASTGLVAFINYLLSYVEGISNLNVLHLFPVRDAATKIYNSKVKDILQGVHPDIMPTITKVSGVSSIVLNYEDILGVSRHNSYEIASAGTSSLRGSDFHVAILDEYASYKKPYEVEAVVEPMMPEEGFSLSIFASTFDDKVSPAYREKIIQAQEHPDEWKIIFVPWFVSYPEVPYDCSLDSLELTEYDQNVILPAMADYGFPPERWGCSIRWYHQKSAKMSEANMHKEFPTTLEEVLAIGQAKTCFTPESLQKQEKNILPDTPYQLVTDTLTNKSELKKTEDSPIKIYKPPIAGEKYMITCDPIGSNSDDSDFFAASIWRQTNNEQVATLYIRGIMVEDMADLIIGLSKIYNRAIVCPELNMSSALQACLRAKNFFSFYYTDKVRKAHKEAGIRTTVSSKPDMLDKLQLLLDGGRIIIHSEETLRQLKAYEKRVKKSGAISFSAPKGDNDDLVTTAFIYAGTLDSRRLAGKSTQGYAFL